MKNYTNDSTILASLIIGVSIILSTLIYSIMDSNIITTKEGHRYSLLKTDKGTFNTYKIDHYTGDVWGIYRGEQYKLPELDD